MAKEERRWKRDKRERMILTMLKRKVTMGFISKLFFGTVLKSVDWPLVVERE